MSRLSRWLQARRDRRIVALEHELSEVIDELVRTHQAWQGTLDCSVELRRRLTQRDELRVDAQRERAQLKGELALALDELETVIDERDQALLEADHWRSA